MTTPDICERIVRARDAGQAIVRVERLQAASVGEAARTFGLAPTAALYREVSRQEARAALVAVLREDMAYRCELMTPDAAGRLADEFLDLFAPRRARHFTNGDRGQPGATPGQGVSWNPATDATFDAGILVLDGERAGCAWFMDED